jgi:tetratricopeptide (TPR) repeat protein
VEPSRIVHHASRAVRVGTLLQYGPMAAVDAERTGAHRQAAETLRLVLEHSDALDPVSRARLSTRRAYSLYVVNDYEAALAEIEVAVTAAQVCADPVVLADALVVRSRIVFFARGPATARRSAQQAVALLEGAGDAKLAAALIELARTHSNLATVGIVSQPTEASVRYAQRALEIVKGPGPDDLCAQALCYLGSGRLSLGDARGADDIEQCLAMGAQETRLEIRVRAYVNAAGSAYRWGRFADARRYISEGLRLAADGEFAAGEYRLHLTSAAISASAGEWDAAIAGLRELLRGDGRAGLMVPLVRALLARLLARRGESASARAVLAQALADPMAQLDSYVAGPLAVAEVEIGWLDGTLDAVPPRVTHALELAVDCGHTVMLGELASYLRRAELTVAVDGKVPDPWGAALAGSWQEAAAVWGRLGERYEQAVETALGARGRARVAALDTLKDLGAVATRDRLGDR